MGRITIFSADGCPHSIRARVELQKRGIPFVEISITKYPNKRDDMLLLSNKLSTPQVFFNTRHIGGADDTIQLLEQWDADKRRYKTPYARYNAEIALQPDPVNPRFAIPLESEHQVPPAGQCATERPADDSIRIPDGNLISIMRVTEMLKAILPFSDNVVGTTLFKKSFTGKQALKAISTCFDLGSHAAVEFGCRLSHHKILLCLTDKNIVFNGEESALYRLHCHNTPAILNSYCVWSKPVKPENYMCLIRRLSQLMIEIEIAMTDDTGRVDLKSAVKTESYANFEHMACALQTVDLATMDDTMKIAFGVNLYNLMIKYARLKVGFGTSGMNRSAFYRLVSFYVGPHIYSFQDWEHGILRGNRKAPYTAKRQIGKSDPRMGFIVLNPDCRIHFGLNCGAKSCPPINFFTPEKLEDELALVASSFCEDDEAVEIIPERFEIQLSKIFKWYKIDFAETTNGLTSSIYPFLRYAKQQQLSKIMNGGQAIKILFKEYDWSTNAKEQVPFDVESLRPNRRVLWPRRKRPLTLLTKDLSVTPSISIKA